MIVEAALFCVTSLLLALWWRGRSQRRLPPLAPGGMWANLSRKGYSRLTNFHEQAQWCQRHSSQDTSHGAVFRHSLPLRCHLVACCDYRLARTVLAGSADGSIAESDKTARIQNLNIFPGVCSLLTYQTAHPERARLRKHLYTPFSTSNLQKTTVHILNSGVRRLMGRLEQHATDGRDVDMKKLTVMTTFDVLTRSLFDISLDENDVFNADDFLGAQDAAMREAVKLFLNPWHRYMTWLPGVVEGVAGEKRLREIGRLIVDRYRAEQGEGVSRSVSTDKTIMSHIMSHDYPSEEHRISDVIVFMVAGHETTAHTMSFFLYCLAKHPQVLKKLQSELDAIEPTGSSVDSGHDDQKTLTMSDISGAGYFNKCLKESQRLYPVAPIISRNTSVDIVHNGMTIPKDSIVAVLIGSMMRQDWIQDADSYIPERWNENAPQIGALKDMFLPFSVGKRSCVGQNLALLELRVIVSNIVRNFDLTLVNDPELDLFITMKPIDFYLRVSKR